MTPALAHALKYAALGWAVLPLHGVKAGLCSCGKNPCGPGNRNAGKHPNADLAPHGVHDASADPARISEWFTRAPGANVGIATGEPSGFVALDIDPRNGGDDVLTELERTHGKLPPTAMQLTGGGGYHYLLKYTGARLRSPGKGIDVKSSGGYIVAEPSTHLTGGHYAWEGSCDPTEGHPIADAPAWLLAPEAPARLPGTRSATGFLPPQRIADLKAALEYIPADDYHTWISVGQALHSTEAPEAFELWDTWSQRSAAYDGSTRTKWPTFNAGGALHVESIFAWAKEAGWSNDAPPPPAVVGRRSVAPAFVPPTTPSELLQLPGALGAVVDLANRTAPKPQPQFAVQAALALGAAVLGRRYRTTRDNWPSLYLVNVGKSASGKEHARTIIDSILTAAQLGHLMGPGGYTSDAAVFSAAINQPCHLSVVDELGAMLGNAKAQGNFHKRQALDALTQAWGVLHGTLRPLGYSTMALTAAQRAELGSRVIHRPAISFLGMTTPRTFYGALSEQAIEGGFLNRLLIVESHQGRQLSRPAEPLEVPDSIVEWCLAARTPSTGGNLAALDPTHDQTPVPRVVDFTPGATGLFRDYEAECLASMDALESEGLAEMQGRSVEKALRVALILAVSENVSGPRINSVHATWAIAYVRHYTDQTIEAVRRHMHGSQFAQWRADFLEIIGRNGERGRTERELAQFSRTFAGLELRVRRAVLESLRNDGLADYVKIESIGGRGRPRLAWVKLEADADAA